MSQKPAAKVINPSQVGSAVTPETYDALRDAQETAERRAELESRNVAKANKVAEHLSAEYYIREKTWAFLFHDGRQLSVSEFYPDINVAVDKFYSSEDDEIGLVTFKKEALAKHGIKYAFLTPQKSLADLEVELGL